MKTLLCILLLMLNLQVQAAPVLQGINGQRSDFSSLRGKWVMLHYWAAWCPTCLQEIPVYNRFYKNHKNKPVVLFAINYDNLPVPEQKELIQSLHIQYPSLISNPAKDLGLGEIIGLPVTFVFNPEGALVATLYGAQTSRALDRVIQG